METAIDASALITQDAAFVWHPYNKAPSALPPIPIASGSGAFLIGYDGRRYFDAISSWWVNLHGHCHPYIAKSIARQAETLEQVIFTDFTHAGAVELAVRLTALLKMGKARVFYSENGSTAVETALKMAQQYWVNRQQQGHAHSTRTKIIAFQNAYHGDTFGAMSVSERSIFTRPFRPYLFDVAAITPPSVGQEENSLKQLQKIIAQGDVAAFIFEPTLQGASGMRPHAAAGLDALMALCRKYGVITIADEVMTGFGRTGPLFACDQLAAKPDIMCLAKGLTGGFLPLAATVCKEDIFQAFVDERIERSFLHGHSYCGNPLACAAALASLDLCGDPACARSRQTIEMCHTAFQKTWGNHPRLKRCTVAGTILAMEYRDQENQSTGYQSPWRDRLMRYFLQHNIFLRPLGNVLYLMPPYCTRREDLEHTYACMQSTLEDPL